MRLPSSWLSVVARRMLNVFLHPDIIYKQTRLYQMESDALARSDAMQEKVNMSDCKLLISTFNL